MTLHLYSVFHLNLAYSAIREDQRPQVVEKCYWPLLETIASESWPCGIEFSGWTLEQIMELDPSWVAYLMELVGKDLVEVVGSGYSQVIAPLVPARVNQENLRLGWKSYGELLEVSPTLALIPEQAYSAGYAALLAEFGLSGFVMEWNNPRAAHPEWPSEALYRPQQVRTATGSSLPVLWNHSITFQKFQRFAHGELLVEEMIEWLLHHEEQSEDGFFSLYGNDVEVFDFRPGRYMSEEPIQKEGEWVRIRELIQHLKIDQRFAFVLPSQALGRGLNPQAPALRLESPEQPAPVKKQTKYNIVRWAVTGRDDYTINSQCHQILQAFEQAPAVDDDEWRRLLFHWSSDFRTHITDERWAKFLHFLNELFSRWVVTPAHKDIPSSFGAVLGAHFPSSVKITEDDRFIRIHSDRISCVLNMRRGLAIHTWIDREVSGNSVFGTLPIGTFESIRLGADWYTGNITFHPPGFPQVTDLAAVTPDLNIIGDSVFLNIVVDTPLGQIQKTLTIDTAEGVAHMRYRTQFSVESGSLRFGHVALRVEDHPAESFFYRTNLGGSVAEVFDLQGRDFDHGQGISNLISANHALGNTEGLIELLAGGFGVQATLDADSRGAVGMVSVRKDVSGHLVRLCFSAREVDDTSRQFPKSEREFGVTLRAATV